MSKRKFKKGAPVKNFNELFEHDYFIAMGKTLCAGFVQSWQIRMARNIIETKGIFIAERLTNEEFYAEKTDNQISEMLEDRLCDFCPLPDYLKGVHCYGGEPVMCNGSYCDKALKAWKEDYVE